MTSAFINKAKKFIGPNAFIRQVRHMPLLFCPQVYWCVASWQIKVNNKVEIKPASGMSICKKDAISAALGEAIERYCASIVPLESLKLSSQGKLDKIFMDPALLPRAKKEEYEAINHKIRAYRSEAALYWVKAVSLPGGKQGYVPASLAFFDFSSPVESERFWIQTTRGLACHQRGDMALESSILEVIEHDALSTSWLTQKTLPEIHISVLSAAMKKIVCELEKAKIEVRLAAATNDIEVPCVVAGLFTSDSQMSLPAACVGSAAGLTYKAAATRAIFEAVKMFHVNYSRMKNGEIVPKTIENFRNHSFYYSFPENAERVREMFSWKCGNAMNHQGLELKKTSDLTTLLKDKGYSIWWVDLAPPIIKRKGVVAGRVIIPELQPLSPYPEFNCLESHRIRTSNINLDIHPFG